MPNSAAIPLARIPPIPPPAALLHAGNLAAAAVQPLAEANPAISDPAPAPQLPHIDAESVQT